MSQNSKNIWQLTPAMHNMYGSALRLISVIALVVLLFGALATSSANAEDASISIYKNHAEDSLPFNCTNMFPGDSITKDYNVKISHKAKATVSFRANIRDGYEKLSEVLMCKVVLQGDTLYDGLMKDMPQSIDSVIPVNDKKSTELVYSITAYLSTSVGNDYMDKPLVADFKWWVEQEEVLEPELGGGFIIILWYALLTLSILMLILIAYIKRKDKKEAQNDTTIS